MGCVTSYEGQTTTTTTNIQYNNTSKYLFKSTMYHHFLKIY